MTSSRTLYRSSSNKMLAGVAGGLAEYFDVDAVLVRVGWVVACFVTAGVAFLLHLALAIIMPRQETVEAELLDDEGDVDDASESRRQVRARRAGARSAGDVNRSRNLVAAVLIVAGALALLVNFGVLSWFRWDVLWPVILIALGAAIVIGRRGT